MLGFLPERVYRAVKDDVEFQAWEIALNEAIESDDLVQRVVKEESFGENGGLEWVAKRDAVFDRLLTPVLRRNARIMETNDESALLAMLEAETDIENRLFIIQNLIGVVYYLSDDPKILEYMQEFIRQVEAGDLQFSEKILEEYFTYRCFQIKREIFHKPRTRFRLGMFKDYCEQMDGIIEMILRRCPEREYAINLFRHCKVLQMAEFFASLLDRFGPRYELIPMIDNEVLPQLTANNFKYDDFGYHKIMLYDSIAKYFFDLRHHRFFFVLDDIIGMINASFRPENRRKTVKALNYYNDCLIIYYLNLVTKYRKVLEKIPNYPGKIDLKMMSAEEKQITATFKSSTKILKEKMAIEPYMSANKISNLCDQQMAEIQNYLRFNHNHFKTMNQMAKKLYVRE